MKKIAFALILCILAGVFIGCIVHYAPIQNDFTASSVPPSPEITPFILSTSPVISSPTHPNESIWYCNKNPFFTWIVPTNISGIAGYSYVLDESPLTVPYTFVESIENSKYYTDVADGTLYFHVRAKDNAGNWGPASHYRINIPKRLTTNMYDSSVNWNPDGSKFVFVSQLGNYTKGLHDTNLWIMNANGTNKERLTLWDYCQSPTWSPDGKKIAFSTVNELWVMNSDGSNKQKLVSEKEMGCSHEVAWSPDGKKIAFNGWRFKGLWIMNQDGSDKQRLTTNWPLDIAWNPCGDKIMYEIFETDTPEILVMNSDGSNEQKIAIGSVSHPAWGPDGKVYFSFVVSDKGWTIWSMNADGSNIRELTDGGYYGFSFSPDGKRITFEHAGDIYIIGADGKGKQKLVETGRAVYVYKPSWSHDGTKIVFESSEGLYGVSDFEKGGLG